MRARLPAQRTQLPAWPPARGAAAARWQQRRRAPLAAKRAAAAAGGAGGDPAQQQQQQQLAARLGPLLSGRRVLVAWDLDNVPLSAARLLPAVRELQALVCEAGGAGRQDVSCRLYANQRTCDTLLRDAWLRGALEGEGCVVVRVSTRDQAADVALTSEAAAFARQQARRGALVLASNDRGFAVLLAWAASLGVSTLVLTQLASPKRLPGLLPDPASHALAAACHATLAWRAKGAAAQDRQPLPSCAAQWLLPPGGSGSGASVVEALWLNPRACMRGGGA